MPSRADGSRMLAFFKSLRSSTRKQSGLSLIEVVVVIFVVGAVGFLAAPIVFPGDSKSPDAELRTDIELLRQVMDLRMSSYDADKTGGLGVEANIGVYAAYGQFEGKATLDSEGKPAFYCLRGVHPTGAVLFFTSKDGAITPTPADPASCPGGVAQGGQQGTEGTSPSQSPEVTTPAAPGESVQPEPTPIPENTQSGANN